jgi:cysteine desulfurase/selenocysteine lyase
MVSEKREEKRPDEGKRMVRSDAMFDASAIRRQFPLLEKSGLVYLDSAATAQKPEVVLQAMDLFYRTQNGNAHRGMHPLAEAATEVLEGARERVKTFVNAKSTEEIIFTKSSTESINLVAHSLRSFCKQGDAIVTTVLEHHSNIVPWQQLQDTGVEVRFVPCDEEGVLDLDVLEKYLSDGNVKLVAVTGQSNVLGVRPDVERVIAMAHKAGALVLVDAAQSIAHMQTDVQKLDCDFLAFSAHKLYGPLGIGILYGKKKLLSDMPPFLGGGMMIREVTQKGFTTADLPQKFEAGTQPIAEAAGLHAAMDWLSQYSWNEIAEHEDGLIAHAVEKLSEIPGLGILGPKDPTKMHGCVSFVIDGVHPHDLTDILGQKGICLRAGHQCAQPLHKSLEIGASTRLSVAIYNTKEEIDRCVDALTQAVKTLRR